MVILNADLTYIYYTHVAYIHAYNMYVMLANARFFFFVGRGEGGKADNHPPTHLSLFK